MRILGLSGSLRQGSYNTALLDLAVDVSPDGVDVVIGSIDVPLYNGDVEAQGDPEAVHRLKEAVRRADGLLIATPEYQHGVPGPLKNALDWASRPVDDPPLARKPVAVMGATTGAFGTARAQTQLRQTLLYNDCPMVNAPEVLVARAGDKVVAGEVVDDTTRTFVTDLVEALAGLVDRQRVRTG